MKRVARVVYPLGQPSNDPALRVKNKVAIALTIDELVTSQEFERGGYPKRVARVYWLIGASLEPVLLAHYEPAL